MGDRGHGLWKVRREPEQPCFFKNMISTYTNDFSWRKMTQTCQILKGFLWLNSSREPRIQKDSVFFLLSYLVCRQIWLNYFVNDGHFCYITKSLKLTRYKMSSMCKIVKRVCLKICSTCRPRYGQKALWTGITVHMEYGYQWWFLECNMQ